MKTKCVFCQISSKELPTEFVYEDDEIVVFRDIRPKAPMHLLLIPRKHIKQPPTKLSESDWKLIGRMFELTGRLAQKLGFANRGWRIINNNGAAAGQEMEHFHLHVLSSKAIR